MNIHQRLQKRIPQNVTCGPLPSPKKLYQQLQDRIAVPHFRWSGSIPDIKSLFRMIVGFSPAIASCGLNPGGNSLHAHKLKRAGSGQRQPWRLAAAVSRRNNR